MSPTKRGGIYYLYIPKQAGGVALRTTGTGDKDVYKGMKRMLATLKGARRWKLLHAVIDGRLTLGQLYDAYTANTLDALDASLSASRLDQHVLACLQSLRSLGRAPRYVAGVEAKLESFIASTPSGTTVDLTPAAVTGWLATLRATPGTRRQYLYAVTGFARYLTDIGVLATYPLGHIRAPKKNAPRERWETEANDKRIVDAASPKYRALFAFIKATGCDVSTAFRTHRRDVDLERAKVRLRGTKTASRDVPEADIEAWALPYLRAYLAEKTPNALLWPAGQGKPGKHGTAETPYYSVSGAGHHHTKCCAALELDDYTLKDARHSVAVRMRFQGKTFEEIAGQLGNSAWQVAKVYARFQPSAIAEAK
jgi:integrase